MIKLTINITDATTIAAIDKPFPLFVVLDFDKPIPPKIQPNNGIINEQTKPAIAKPFVVLLLDTVYIGVSVVTLWFAVSTVEVVITVFAFSLETSAPQNSQNFEPSLISLPHLIQYIFPPFTTIITN